MPRLDVGQSQLGQMLRIVSAEEDGGGGGGAGDSSLTNLLSGGERVDSVSDGPLETLTVPPCHGRAAEAQKRRPQLLEIAPSPGVCFKCRLAPSSGSGSSGSEKVFINLCSSELIPQPETLSDEQLQLAMSNGRVEQLRVPMSLGERHAELDKSGASCSAYDVVVHPQLLARVCSSDVYATFMALVLIDAMRSKFSLAIEPDSWLTLKNKRYLGRMPRHFIRGSDLPLVQEFSGLGTVPPGPLAAGAAGLPPSAPAHQQQQQEQLRAVNSRRQLQLLPATAAAGGGQVLVARTTLPPEAGGDLRVQCCGRRLLVHSSRAHVLYDEQLPFEPATGHAAAGGGGGGGSVAAFCPASGKFALVLRPVQLAM